VLVGVGALFALFAWQRTELREGTAMSEPIEVTAVLLEYTPNAMVDDFEDGGFESFDASRIRVTAPEPWAGSERTLYHSGEVPPESPWRAVGRRVRFAIAKDDLAEEKTLFAGAVANLRAVPGEGIPEGNKP
jgi:hypothetical protein